MNDPIIPLPEMQNQVSISRDWLKKRDELIQESNSISVITTDIAFRYVSEILSRITKLSSELEKMRTILSAPYLKAQRSIKKKSDEARESLENAKEVLKKKISVWIESERERVEMEKRAAEEKQRNEIEAQLAEQDALKEAGLIQQNADFVPAVTPVPEVKEVAKSADVWIFEDVEWSVTDETLIPAAFKTFDERKVNAFKRENKDLIMKKIKENPDCALSIIPGIVFLVTTKVSGR